MRQLEEKTIKHEVLETEPIEKTIDGLPIPEEKREDALFDSCIQRSVRHLGSGSAGEKSIPEKFRHHF